MKNKPTNLINYKNTVHKSPEGNVLNFFKGCTLMLVMTLMVMGCDSIVDQQTEADSGIATSDISGVLSVDQAPRIECIDPGNDVSNEKRNPRSVERGRDNSRNPIFGDCNSGRDSTTEIVEVTSATGRIWMDRNLGANRAATSSDDNEAYGDLYQWGRLADGHQVRTSGTTTDLSTTDTPDHGDFITPTSSTMDWLMVQNDDLWQGVDGINNPCPVGYRLPTRVEWQVEIDSWGVGNQNAAGAFASPLKLTLAGGRRGSDGSLYNVGSIGYYWSGTVAGTVALGALFPSGSFTASRSLGASVRCIKD
jgi:uncharacterized protein (TIGR02145 family)